MSTPSELSDKQVCQSAFSSLDTGPNAYHFRKENFNFVHAFHPGQAGSNAEASGRWMGWGKAAHLIAARKENVQTMSILLANKSVLQNLVSAHEPHMG